MVMDGTSQAVRQFEVQGSDSAAPEGSRGGYDLRRNDRDPQAEHAAPECRLTLGIFVLNAVAAVLATLILLPFIVCWVVLDVAAEN